MFYNTRLDIKKLNIARLHWQVIEMATGIFKLIAQIYIIAVLPVFVWREGYGLFKYFIEIR